LTDKFTLEPLVVGRFPAFPLKRFLYQIDSSEIIEAPCISWLARSTSTDALVLVDTGPASPTEETSKFHVEIDVKRENRIDLVLHNHGVDPEQITDVVFTHLHFDHCSYAEFLPNARILVQKRELQYAVAPNREHRTGYEAGYRNVFPGWMRVFDRIQAIDGDLEVSPGFRVLALPGHTPGSSGAIFDTAKGRHAVVGDLVNQMENWEGAFGKHIPPTQNCGVSECMDSFTRLEKEAEIVLASHDYRMFDSSKYG